MSVDENIVSNKQIEFLKWQLEYVMDQIKIADNKINFLLAVYLALLTVVFTQIEKIIGFFVNCDIHLGWKIVSGITCLLLFTCIIKFFAFFVNTVKPRTHPKKILEQEDYKSFIFWEDVANMGYENFKNVPLETRHTDLEKQVFINSFIAMSKFKNVTNACIFLIPTLILLLILVSFIRVIGG